VLVLHERFEQHGVELGPFVATDLMHPLAAVVGRIEVAATAAELVSVERFSVEVIERTRSHEMRGSSGHF
jgi:hypothetical protein